MRVPHRTLAMALALVAVGCGSPPSVEDPAATVPKQPTMSESPKAHPALVDNVSFPDSVETRALVLLEDSATGPLQPHVISVDGTVFNVGSGEPKSIDRVVPAAATAAVVDGLDLIVASEGYVYRVPPENESPATAIGPDVRAVAPGYGGYVFTGDIASKRIIRTVPGSSHEVLAEGVGALAMVPYGGRLVVADGANLVWLSLTDGSVSPLVEGIGHVDAIVMDHVGFFVVNRVGIGLARVTTKGEVTPIDGPGAGALALDPQARKLWILDSNGELTGWDYLALIGEDPAPWIARDDRPMRPFEIDGVGLSGAEYWPFRGDKKPDYPADVLWGFYPEKGVVFEGEAAPESATPAALACALESYRALESFVANLPDEFHQAVANGASPRFYLWINDYSEASDPFPHEMRPAQLWYWQRKPRVPGRIPGYWKWETTLTQGGECQIPDPSTASWPTFADDDE